MVKTKSIWADTEKKFFESLKNHFPKNDYVKLNYFIIPESHSCNLNRFYRPSDAFWFSRLKVSSSETFYYFGFGLDNEDEINPNLSLIANQDIKNLEIRVFYRNAMSETSFIRTIPVLPRQIITAAKLLWELLFI